MRYLIFLAVLSLVALLRVYQWHSGKVPIFPKGQESQTVVLRRSPQLIQGQQILRLESLTVILPVNQDLLVGDIVQIEGEADERGRVWYPKISKLGRSSGVLTRLLLWREAIADQMDSSLHEPQASLLKGILLGIDEMPPKFRSDLRRAGLTHLVVASGANLAILASFILKLSGWIYRRTALVLALGVIVLYTLMTGLEPPIIRAAIMAGLSFLAEILGQQPWTGWIFLLTALVMVIISPVYLFSLSFQLSFLATAGVLFLTKPLENRFGKWSLPGFLKASLATTLAAQFMVTPRLISVFGGLSLVSLVSNALVLVWVEFLMAVGFGVSWLGLIVPESIARLLFFIPWGGLSFIIWVARLFSSCRLAYINTPKIAWMNFIPWYLMLLWFFKKPSSFA